MSKQSSEKMEYQHSFFSPRQDYREPPEEEEMIEAERDLAEGEENLLVKNKWFFKLIFLMPILRC